MRCPNCGWNNRISSEERGKRVRKGLKAAMLAGKQIGRPRIVDYAQIFRLRDQGLSIYKIAEALAVSRGSVQHALRKRP